MYCVTVESTFSATHQLRLCDGSLEPRHGHDWRVRVTFAARSLNAEGMVIDFHHAQDLLAGVLKRLQYRDLNERGVLHGPNPTAEVVAEWIFKQLAEAAADTVDRVEVTEAPGCLATFHR